MSPRKSSFQPGDSALAAGLVALEPERSIQQMGALLAAMALIIGVAEALARQPTKEVQAIISESEGVDVAGSSQAWRTAGEP